MKDLLQAVQTLTAPNGTKITIWTDGNEKYLSVSVIYKALGYDGRFNSAVLLAMVFKNRSFQIMTKALPTAAQYVCYLDQIVPILQAFIRLTLISNNPSYRVRDLQDNARAEAERLIEMFNVEVFSKPNSVTVSNIAPADEEPTTTTPENNTSTDIAERSLFDESEQRLTNDETTLETADAQDKLEVPTSKKIAVEIEHSAEAIAPMPVTKSLLEQLAIATGVDKAKLSAAILEMRQEQFDSEMKKLRAMLA